MTGAVIPDNADAIVMKEMVNIKNKNITFNKNIKKNQNIRFVGEDIKKNKIVFHKNSQLTYSKVAILASLGIKKVKVLKKPIISFFSTGDELISIDKKLKKGQIYDSNRYLLRGLLEKFPVIIKDTGVVADDEKKIINKFKKLSKESNLIITTGGVSVGDADYIRNALLKIGSISFWKISIKPGRPLAFGTIGSSYFFGLPGNPVSTSVTFDLFVRPAIYKILSLEKRKDITIKAILVGALRKKRGRVEYKRGILFKKEGKYYVKASGLQGSNILSSLAIANCYIKLGMDIENIKESEIVTTIPFEVSHE
jgi:molybdopterin molybdotransferase